jgi:E3 ubiquitin-protein ligases UBR4 N-terminal
VFCYFKFSPGFGYKHSIPFCSTVSDKEKKFLWHLLQTVSPDDDRDWPLKVYPRTLSILAHVLLLRQNSAERGGLYVPPKNHTYVILWEKVLTTLLKHISTPPSSANAEIDDLNVEHVQVSLLWDFIFLFTDAEQSIYWHYVILLKFSWSNILAESQLLTTPHLP